ncbi:MAG: alpha/beta hydrolase [Phycisphaerales bacterium]
MPITQHDNHPGAETQPKNVRRTVHLVGAEDERIDADVIECGSGRRVVFLHGLVGLNEHWEDVIRRVHTRFACTSVEIPLLELKGSTCSIQGVTDLTIQFLEEHVGEPAILVGNSFGGHVACRIAIKRPDLVRGLVLAGSSGMIERTFVRGAPVRPSREWLREKIGELFHDTSFMREADLDRAHAALSKRSGARAMLRLSKSARRDHMGDEVSAINRPVLLIWGRQDVVTPPSAAQGFLDLLPDARIHWIDECGHAPMIEAPDEFAEAMLSFAADIDTRE